MICITNWLLIGFNFGSVLAEIALYNGLMSFSVVDLVPFIT